MNIMNTAPNGYSEWVLGKTEIHDKLEVWFAQALFHASQASSESLKILQQLAVNYPMESAPLEMDGILEKMKSGCYDPTLYPSIRECTAMAKACVVSPWRSYCYCDSPIHPS